MPDIMRRTQVVLNIQATKNIGVEERYQAILRHHQALQSSGRLEVCRRKRKRRVLLQAIKLRLSCRLRELIEWDSQVISYVKRVERGEVDPYSASSELLGNKELVEG